MRETPKIVSLASALAALVTPAAAAPPIADAADSDGAQIAMEAEEGIQAEAETRLPGNAELMSFTVHQTSDGMMFPQHQSHSSHASHSSHVSHASSSPGGGGPYPPYPTYVPPPAATTSPAPVPASDPMYLACTRASNGLGVNDIASELQQVYGIPENEAVNIAQQALASVLTGGPPCDAYLGD